MSHLPLGRQPFKMKIPAIKLPDTAGGRYALVFSSLQHPGTPNVCMCTCLDDLGRIFSNVPIMKQAIEEAARNPVSLFEVPDLDGPKVNTNLIIGNS